jgi:hypothetical protein
MRLAGYVVQMGEMTHSNDTVIGNSEMKKTLGRFSRRWENNIKVDLREI